MRRSTTFLLVKNLTKRIGAEWCWWHARAGNTNDLWHALTSEVRFPLGWWWYLCIECMQLQWGWGTRANPIDMQLFQDQMLSIWWSSSRCFLHGFVWVDGIYICDWVWWWGGMDQRASGHDSTRSCNKANFLMMLKWTTYEVNTSKHFPPSISWFFLHPNQHYILLIKEVKCSGLSFIWCEFSVWDHIDSWYTLPSVSN